MIQSVTLNISICVYKCTAAHVLSELESGLTFCAKQMLFKHLYTDLSVSSPNEAKHPF